MSPGPQAAPRGLPRARPARGAGLPGHGGERAVALPGRAPRDTPGPCGAGSACAGAERQRGRCVQPVRAGGTALGAAALALMAECLLVARSLS